MTGNHNSVVKAIDTVQFDNEVIGEKALNLIDFWAEWCGPCRTLAPLVEKLAADNEGRLNVYKVDVDAHPELARRYAIRGIPTLLFLRAGEEVERVVGVQPQETLQAHVERLLTADFA